MDRIIDKKASTVDLAVAQALEELGTTRNNVEVEVLSKGGLFSKAHVRVKLLSVATMTENFLNNVLDKMGISSRATAVDKNGTLFVEITGEDSGSAIGYRGEVLDALQYLTLTYLNQEKCDFKKVVIDSENYREKRKETLTALALRLAEKAHRQGRKIELEPMNPFERRVIHSALMDSEIAETASEGEENNRHVVIIPKGVKIRTDHNGLRRSENRRRYDGKAGFDAKRERGQRKPIVDEIPDGNVYKLLDDDYVKPTPVKTGPPKIKSFGGKRR